MFYYVKNVQEQKKERKELNYLEIIVRYSYIQVSYPPIQSIPRKCAQSVKVKQVAYRKYGNCFNFNSKSKIKVNNVNTLN